MGSCSGFEGRALVDPHDIDIEATAIQNLHPWSHKEKEIRLERGAEIEITKIFSKQNNKLKIAWTGKHEASASIRFHALVRVRLLAALCKVSQKE